MFAFKRNAYIVPTSDILHDLFQCTALETEQLVAPGNLIGYVHFFYNYFFTHLVANLMAGLDDYIIFRLIFPETKSNTSVNQCRSNIMFFFITFDIEFGSVNSDISQVCLYNKRILVMMSHFKIGLSS